MHHVEIFRQTGLFSVLFYSSNIWNFEVFHSWMEPWSPERYHLPSDSGLYLFNCITSFWSSSEYKRQKKSSLLCSKRLSVRKKIRFDLWSILCDGKNAFRYFTKPELKCGKSGKTTTLFENLKVKQISLNKIFVLYSNREGEIFSLSLSSEKFGQTVFQSLFNL